MQRNIIRAGAAIAAAAAVAAVPAAALAGKPSNPGNGNGNTNHPNGSSNPSQTHVCKVHNRGYVEGGIVGDVTTDTNNNVTGFTITVMHENHAAKGNPDTSVTSLSGVKVRFDGGTTAISAGERVQLIGKVSFETKKCTSDTSFTPTVTIRRVVVHPAPTPAG